MLNFIGSSSSVITYYVTTIFFMTLEWLLKQRTVRRGYSVHAVTTDVYMLCEVPATVNIYRAECSLSDIDSHFFPNISHCNLLNDCVTTENEWKETLRYQKKIKQQI